MNLLSPLGLLGLIGIPVLILIYIIKSKYREYTISSTFIWELSERFLTKKSKLSKISGILSLILQILTILVLSFALAHPIIKIPNVANNYLFVIDNSASMNINNRFDEAINNINEIVTNAASDSTFSIILAGDEPTTPISYNTSKERVYKVLENLKPTYISSTLTNGLSLAQESFDEDNSLKIYLYTDINYQYTNDNITLVNLALDNEYNAAINALSATTSEDKVTFEGEVISYNVDKTLNVSLYIDDTLLTTIDVEAKADENTPFVYENEFVEFKEAKAIITNEDNLSLDNEYVLYFDNQIDTHKILLVSSNPFFLRSILERLQGNNVTVKSSYSATDTGYDLYIFDSYDPDVLPVDGAIWLFNISKNITNAGFAVQGDVKEENGAILSLTNIRQNEIYDQLTANLLGARSSVREFKHYSVFSNMTTIMSYGTYPMIFAGSNTNENREVVFSFDLHNSDFPLSIDFVILFRNMINYSLPKICEQNIFMCGDDLVVNVVPNCSSLRIYTPSEYSTYLPTNEASTSYTLNELGTYTLEAIVNDVTKTYKIYTIFPKSEQNPVNNVLEGIEIQGEKNDKPFDSTYDIQWLLFIILLIICLIEWEVYVYDQRQIR